MRANSGVSAILQYAIAGLYCTFADDGRKGTKFQMNGDALFQRFLPWYAVKQSEQLDLSIQHTLLFSHQVFWGMDI